MNRQYIMNKSLVLVPLPAGENTADIFLPKGVWTDFYTGKEYPGGSLTVEKPPCSDTAALVRENSVIIEHSGEKESCALRVYALCNGIRVDADVYGRDGEPELCVSFKRNGRSIHVAADGAKPYTVRMINMCAKSVANGLLVIEGSDSVITPDPWTCTMEIVF